MEEGYFSCINVVIALSKACWSIMISTFSLTHMSNYPYSFANVLMHILSSLAFLPSIYVNFNDFTSPVHLYLNFVGILPFP